MDERPTSGAIKRAKKQRKLAHAWSLTDGRCVYCNSETPTMLRTVDHCLPRSHGGWATITNLLPACYHCNHARGTTCPASRLAHPRWQSLVKAMEANTLPAASAAGTPSRGRVAQVEAGILPTEGLDPATQREGHPLPLP